MATMTAILLAIPLGTLSAINQDTWIDYGVRAFSIAGLAMPSFWLGILIILALLIGTQALWGTPWMPPIQYTPDLGGPGCQPVATGVAGFGHRLSVFRRGGAA